MQNLRDKLLKAGLVSADQAKAAEEAQNRKQERPKAPDRRPPPRPPEKPASARPHERPAGARPSERPAGARPPHDRPAGSRPSGARPPPRRAPVLPPPEPGSKEAHRLASLERAAEDKRIRLLVLAAEVLEDVGAQPFYFMTRKGKLRRLLLTQAQAKALESGELAVVERPEPACIEHSLVPAEAAEKLLEIREKAVRFFNRPGQAIGFVTDEEMSGGVSTEAEASDLPEAGGEGGEAEGDVGEPDEGGESDSDEGGESEDEAKAEGGESEDEAKAEGGESEAG